jgi:hypothetical protein
MVHFVDDSFSLCLNVTTKSTDYVTITYVYCMSKDSYVILLVKIVIVRLYVKGSKTTVFTIADGRWYLIRRLKG